MKTIVFLFAGNASSHAFEPLFDGKAAVERACSWAAAVSGVAEVAVLSQSENAQALQNLSLPVENITFKHITQQKWTINVLLEELASHSEGFDAAVFAFADAPFYDNSLTDKLLDDYFRYGAEYCFADGYPNGITPEILNPGTARILADLAKDNAAAVERSALFDVLKTDINSFEIETEIAPKDLRYLRLNLFCGTKRDALQCGRLFALMKQSPEKSLCEIAESSAEVQRTLPAFYALQIAAACGGNCTFCPYPAAAEKKYGAAPATLQSFMPYDSFCELIEKIADFSGDAVVSLSLWGEALAHPQLADFAAVVLQKPSLSLLVETTGEGLTEELASELARLAASCAERTNGQKPINWIVDVDASEGTMYKALHGCDGFGCAVKAVETLLPLFPGAVYPQFLRMKENEAQMEKFYRYWKEKSGNVIIQKYDDFSGAMEPRKVADLTPVKRNACWHLRRDMSVLLDGSVTLCKESVLGSVVGNAFSEPLEEIWKKTEQLYASQLQNSYEGLCKNCDEYYTFNF